MTMAFYAGLMEIIEVLCIAFPRLDLKEFKSVLAQVFQWNQLVGKQLRSIKDKEKKQDFFAYQL